MNSTAEWADKQVVGTNPSPLQFSSPGAARGPAIDPFKSAIVAMLNRRLLCCALSAAGLYFAPFAYTNYGPRFLTGLTSEGAGWSGILVVLLVWPVAALCCVAGLWCAVLLLRRKSLGLLPLVGSFTCGGVLWSMWRLLHH